MSDSGIVSIWPPKNFLLRSQRHCVCAWESVCVVLKERESESEWSKFMCVCVCERERERDGALKCLRPKVAIVLLSRRTLSILSLLRVITKNNDYKCVFQFCCCFCCCCCCCCCECCCCKVGLICFIQKHFKTLMTPYPFFNFYK